MIMIKYYQFYLPKSKFNEDYVDECKRKEQKNEAKARVPESDVDRVIKYGRIYFHIEN